MTKEMRRLTWALLAIGVAVPSLTLAQEPIVSPQKAAEAMQHYSHGKTLERRGLMTDACAEFMQAVELNPQFGKAARLKIIRNPGFQAGTAGVRDRASRAVWAGWLPEQKIDRRR